MKFVAMMAGVLLMAAGCAPEETAMREAASMRWPTLDGNPPLVIAHRGASGYLPEHTIEAYALAIEQGADVIEPDLVFTKDGVLVARHDRYLSTTTDVADRPEFADRKKPNADPNDAPREDWWVEDFTLAEIKTLYARQPWEFRSQVFIPLSPVPTFEEILLLVSALSDELRRPIGIYPETKHPGYFQSIGMDFEAPLLAALDGFDAGPVFIQSFEPEILKRLKGKADAKLVQLVYEETPGAGPNIPLADIAEYADGVGAEKSLLFFPPSEFVIGEFLKDAHALGLFVHFWTFRDDQPNMQLVKFVADGEISRMRLEEGVTYDDTMGVIPVNEARSSEFEFDIYFSAGADGVFTDFPDTAVKARADYLQEAQ